MLPHSRFSVILNPNWSFYLGLDWSNTSYALRDIAALDRGQMTIEDHRLYGGTVYRLSDELMFATEVGHVYSRELDFERSGGADQKKFGLANAFVIRFALVGPF